MIFAVFMSSLFLVVMLFITYNVSPFINEKEKGELKHILFFSCGFHLCAALLFILTPSPSLPDFSKTIGKGDGIIKYRMYDNREFYKFRFEGKDVVLPEVK